MKALIVPVLQKEKVTEKVVSRRKQKRTGFKMTEDND